MGVRRRFYLCYVFRSVAAEGDERDNIPNKKEVVRSLEAAQYSIV